MSVVVAAGVVVGTVLAATGVLIVADVRRDRRHREGISGATEVAMGAVGQAAAALHLADQELDEVSKLPEGYEPTVRCAPLMAPLPSPVMPHVPQPGVGIRSHRRPPTRVRRLP